MNEPAEKTDVDRLQARIDLLLWVAVMNLVAKLVLTFKVMG